MENIKANSNKVFYNSKKPASIIVEKIINSNYNNSYQNQRWYYISLKQTRNFIDYLNEKSSRNNVVPDSQMSKFKTFYFTIFSSDESQLVGVEIKSTTSWKNYWHIFYDKNEIVSKRE